MLLYDRYENKGENMIFELEGKVRLGNEERKFRKSLEAESENAARNKLFSLFGSVNGVNRNAVKIESVKKRSG
jgi:ribosomal protein L20A (L18A)